MADRKESKLLYRIAMMIGLLLIAFTITPIQVVAESSSDRTHLKKIEEIKERTSQRLDQQKDEPFVDINVTPCEGCVCRPGVCERTRNGGFTGWMKAGYWTFLDRGCDERGSKKDFKGVCRWHCEILRFRYRFCTP